MAVRLIERYLTEDIDAVRNHPQFKDIPSDVFDEIIETDPTFKPSSNSVGKYGKWLLSLYKKDGLFKSFFNSDNEQMKGEFIRNIKKTITKYEEYKNDRTKVIEKDIMKFKSVQDMANAIKNAGEAELSDKQKQRQAKKDKPYDLVFSGDIYDVYVPRNHEGNMVLASFGGSKKATWCTAADSELGREYYNRYLNRGGKYYVLINRNDYDDKYQFHFETEQFNNWNQTKTNCLKPVVSKDQKLIDFFLEQGYKKYFPQDVGCEAVFEGDVYSVFVPENYEQASSLAVYDISKRAKWSILNNANVFDHQLKYDGKYYILINRQKPDDKYLFSFDSERFADCEDQRDGTKYLKKVIKKDAKLSRFFIEQGYKRLLPLKKVETTIPKKCISGATLLSSEEAKSLLSKEGRAIYTEWWLRDNGYDSYSKQECNNTAKTVIYDGRIMPSGSLGFAKLGVRPALKISNYQGSPIDNEIFVFGGYKFQIISNDLAVCEKNIGKCAFKRGANENSRIDYETSDIKEYVDDWFNKAYAEYKDDTPKTESYRRIRMREM